MSQLIQKTGKELFENLKCSLCQKYLTVGPIYSVTQSGDTYKCGRCEEIKSATLIRNFCYENIVSNIDLPCSYEECNVVLQWGQVVEHEQICNYRTIQCIGCDTFIKLCELEEHFKSDLKPDDNRFFTNVIENYCLSPLKSATLLLKTFTHNYIVVIHFDCNRDMYAGVYCLQNLPQEETNFELKIISDNEMKSVIFKGNVNEYIEKKHCVNCTLGKCQLDCHVRSKKYNKNTCSSKSSSHHYNSYSGQCRKKCCYTNSTYEYDNGNYCNNCSSKSNAVTDTFQIKVDFDLILKLFSKPENVKYSLHIFEPTRN